MAYGYAEQYANGSCDECGASPNEYDTIGCWVDESDAYDSPPEKTLCLACAVERQPKVPHLEELLYEGDVIDGDFPGEVFSLLVETPFGKVAFDVPVSTERVEWSDPGGGTNSAGTPRRSQEYETTRVEGSATVHVIEPREVMDVAKTSYWDSYAQNQLE